MASDEEEEWKAEVGVDALMAAASNALDVTLDEERAGQPPPHRRSKKRNGTLYSDTLAELVRQEIAEAKAALDQSVEAQRTAKEALEMQQRIAFLQAKLEAHHRWMVDLQRLLVSAPLLDFALRHPDLGTPVAPPNNGDDESKDDDIENTSAVGDPEIAQDDLKALDEWRQDAKGKLFSSILIAKHVNSYVVMSQANAHKLLDEFADPTCDFAIHFDTRGWSIGGNLDSKLLTFRASRVLRGASAATVATAIWKSLHYDDILRTFAPTVLDATIVYRSDLSCSSVVERTIQIEAGTAKSLVFIDSMEDYSRDGVQCWQIAVETCDDPCVLAFATQAKAADSVSPPLSPFNARGSANSLDLVVAARCAQLGPSGVLVQLAGSVQHDGTSLLPARSHVDLVQYMINMLPVYEELQLLART